MKDPIGSGVKATSASSRRIGDGASTAMAIQPPLVVTTPIRQPLIAVEGQTRLTALLLAERPSSLERAWQYVRPHRLTVGDVGYESAYETEPDEPARAILAAFAALDDAVAKTNARGALLLYDEAHLLVDDRGV